MDGDPLRYDRWIEEALRHVVWRALEHTAEHGLPGEHHFYITFQTTFPGVEISDHLTAQYPEEMTIVLQRRFWDLEVLEDAFSVTLSFSGKTERLRVPFAAVVAFADPSVKFGLQLRVDLENDDLDDVLANGDEEPDLTVADADDLDGPDDGPDGDRPKPGDSNVVTLDAFRKK